MNAHPDGLGARRRPRLRCTDCAPTRGLPSTLPTVEGKLVGSRHGSGVTEAAGWARDGGGPVMQPTAASPAGLPASFRRWSKLPVPARRIVVEVRRWSHPARRPHPTVAVEMVDGVAVMTFDDGKVNAISARMTQLLSEALDGLETSDARALVLAGRERRPPRPARARRMEPPVAHLRPAPARRCRVHRQHHRRRGRLLLLTDVRLGADGAFKIGFSEASIGIHPPPRGGDDAGA
jgi:hypothetical protein